MRCPRPAPPRNLESAHRLGRRSGFGVERLACRSGTPVGGDLGCNRSESRRRAVKNRKRKGTERRRIAFAQSFRLRSLEISRLVSTRATRGTRATVVRRIARRPCVKILDPKRDGRDEGAGGGGGGDRSGSADDAEAFAVHFSVEARTDGRRIACLDDVRRMFSRDRVAGGVRGTRCRDVRGPSLSGRWWHVNRGVRNRHAGWDGSHRRRRAGVRPRRGDRSSPEGRGNGGATNRKLSDVPGVFARDLVARGRHSARCRKPAVAEPSCGLARVHRIVPR